MRLVRVMCAGRVDLGFILRAFAKGHDGVFIGGCRLGECNYTTQGNFDALGVSHMGKKILNYMGLKPDRLRIEFMSGAEGSLLAEKTDEFTNQVRESGPLGRAEGLDKKRLGLMFESALNLVPYLRLAERERIRLPEKKKEIYEDFFSGEEFNSLFDDIFPDLWAMGQIMALLKKTPMPTGDISEALGLNPSEVSRYMNRSSRLGWVRYDSAANCYMLTG